MTNFDYNLFDQFLESFVKRHNSFVLKNSTEKDVVTKESINRLYKIFVDSIQKNEKDKDKDKEREPLMARMTNPAQK